MCVGNLKNIVTGRTSYKMQLRSGYTLSAWPTISEARRLAYPFDTTSQMRDHFFVRLTKCTLDKDHSQLSATELYQNRLFILVIAETLLENQHLDRDPLFRKTLWDLLGKLRELSHFGEYRMKLVRVLGKHQFF